MVDIIICAKFGEDRLRGLGAAEGQIFPFSIDFDRRSYNTLFLTWECVIRKVTVLIYTRVVQDVQGLITVQHVLTLL